MDAPSRTSPLSGYSPMSRISFSLGLFMTVFRVPSTRVRPGTRQIPVITPWGSEICCGIVEPRWIIWPAAEQWYASIGHIAASSAASLFFALLRPRASALRPRCMVHLIADSVPKFHERRSFMCTDRGTIQDQLALFACLTRKLDQGLKSSVATWQLGFWLGRTPKPEGDHAHQLPVSHTTRWAVNDANIPR